MKKLFLAMLVIAVSSVSAPVFGADLSVVEDTFIDSFYNDDIMGDEHSSGDTHYRKLWVGEVVNPTGYTDPVTGAKGPGFDDTYFARTFLKFDLSGYTDITTAYLYLRKDQSGTQGWENNFYTSTGRYLGIGTGTQTVYRYIGTDPWSESSLTWDNSPKPFSDASLFVKGSSQDVTPSSTWVIWNVTSFADAAVGGQLSLVVASGDPFSIYYSSENGNAGLVPFLRVEGTVAPEPLSAGLFLLGGGALAVLRRRKA